MAEDARFDLRRLQRTSLIAHLLAVGLLAGAWYVHHERVALRISSRALWEKRPQPYLVAGFLLDVPAHTTPLSRFEPAPVSAPAMRLILAMSDACQFSWGELPYWHRLFQSLGRGWRGEVWLVTTNGSSIATEIAAQLAKQNITHYTVRPKNPILFRGYTGVALTPLTLVVDSAWRLRYTATDLEQVGVARIVDILRTNRTESVTEGGD